MKNSFLLNQSLLYAVALGTLVSLARSQTTNAPAPADASDTNSITKLNIVTVVAHASEAHSQILPELGATSFSISKTQIESQAQGDNAPFNQIILRAPGVAQDSAANGDLHVRGEHGNLQYRINDILLPEGISGFGLELDPRFVEGLQLITGSLPAQYGFRTAGIINIQTKNGAFENGGEVGVYGGSYDTIRPNFEYGGSSGKWNFFTDGSYERNDLGIENPTNTSTAIHDSTSQYKTFDYLSYVIDDSSRISFIASLAFSDFQVPDTAGLVNTNFATAGIPGLPGSGAFQSSDLNENQNEQNYYGVAAYQKTVGDFNMQVAAYGRASSVHFTPDPVGDLYFNGVASDVDRRLNSGGLQSDASYEWGDYHTLRGGLMLLDESVSADSSTTVFNTDPITGNPVPGTLHTIPDSQTLHGIFGGIYLEDEWKLLPQLTINYGARFDVFDSSFDDENQLSPRINLIYRPTHSTTFHAGYSRYFTPPPVEDIPGGSVAKFNGTSNASSTDQDDPVKAERANYFDVGASQQVLPGLQLGLDGYYKRAKNQLDDGLFGQTLILSAFNYAKAEIYGVEFTAAYTTGGFSTYANLAYSVARGEDWNSSQFLFDKADLSYVSDHWIYLDHDQRISGSFGASYFWKEVHGGTRVYVDALYGSGLRTDSMDGDTTIPNGGTVPSYYSLNMGVEQAFKWSGKDRLKVRLDVVNITDNVYALRDGSGVGVNAAQYGMRRGFFGSLSYLF